MAYFTRSKYGLFNPDYGKDLDNFEEYQKFIWEVFHEFHRTRGEVLEDFIYVEKKLNLLLERIPPIKKVKTADHKIKELIKRVQKHNFLEEIEIKKLEDYLNFIKKRRNFFAHGYFSINDGSIVLIDMDNNNKTLLVNNELISNIDNTIGEVRRLLDKVYLAYFDSPFCKKRKF